MTTVGKSIEEAKRNLLEGNPIGIPTETVYGLAANGLDTTAITRVFEIKRRPFFNPLIYHTSSWAKMQKFLLGKEDKSPTIFDTLIKNFSPGPLTILVPCNHLIPEIGRAGLSRVGVRIPKHPLTLQLLDALDFPLVAPSANIYGRVSPTSVNHVIDQLGGEVPYILDGGDCPIGIESTVVGWEDEKLKIYRLGGITMEDIRAIYPDIALNTHSGSNPSSPGQLSSHYTTRQKILVGDTSQNIILCKKEKRKFGILSFQQRHQEVQESHQRVLSNRGNLQEAAANLFRYLNELQALDIEVILAEYVPNEGLGLAINDKLRRASFTSS